MSIDYDNFREKIPRTPALIPFIFINDINIDEELKKIFGSEKIFTDEQIQKIKSDSLSLRDFLTNIKTILLFANIDAISIDQAIKKQYAEEKETLGRIILKFLLEKDITKLTSNEKQETIDFGLGIEDKNKKFHLHPLISEMKKSTGNTE